MENKGEVKRYVRFMGEHEIIEYLMGMKLENKTNWAERSKSTSTGFCFFDDSVDPVERMEYLTGVIDMDAVAVFEPIGEDKFEESEGQYRDPLLDNPQTFDEALFAPVIGMTVKEYCLTSYSKDTLRLVKLGKPIPWNQSENGKNIIIWQAGLDV